MTSLGSEGIALIVNALQKNKFVLSWFHRKTSIIDLYGVDGEKIPVKVANDNSSTAVDDIMNRKNRLRRATRRLLDCASRRTTISLGLLWAKRRWNNSLVIIREQQQCTTFCA